MKITNFKNQRNCKPQHRHEDMFSHQWSLIDTENQKQIMDIRIYERYNRTNIYCTIIFFDKHSNGSSKGKHKNRVIFDAIESTGFAIEEESIYSYTPNGLINTFLERVVEFFNIEKHMIIEAHG